MPQSKCQALGKKAALAINDEEHVHLSAEAWYAHHNINEDELKYMLRSKCKLARHYPKRNPWDRFMNNFEPHIHGCNVMANMDIQALIGSSGTIKYITKYQFKGEPTREDEARKDGRNPKMTVIPHHDLSLDELCSRYIENELKTRKLTFFEAIWNNLQLPIVEMSKRPVNISLNGLINETAAVENDIDASLNGEAVNTHQTSIFLFYMKRPDCFESLSLADFCSKFQWTDTPFERALFTISYFKQGKLKTRYFILLVLVFLRPRII